MVPPSQGASRSAFTLTELLIAIVVIAVLAALLFSTATTMIANGKKVTCMSNMRSVGQLVVNYGADHNGSLLPALEWSSQTKSGGLRAWFHFLDEGGYLPKALWSENRKGIMTCPSREDAPYIEVGGKRYFDGVHFGMNVYPGFENMIVYRSPMNKFTQIQRPEKTFLLGETNGRYALYPAVAQRRLHIYPHPRDGGGSNLFFADGHVEYCKGELPVVSKREDLKAGEETYPFY